MNLKTMEQVEQEWKVERQRQLVEDELSVLSFEELDMLVTSIKRQRLYDNLDCLLMGSVSWEELEEHGTMIKSYTKVSDRVNRDDESPTYGTYYETYKVIDKQDNEHEIEFRLDNVL